jgi:uncharacterized RDD family membrane protein YckC
MTERSGGMTPGDPLGGGGSPEPERHESGLPGVPRAPEAPPADAPPAPGYTTPPPPGAGGFTPTAPAARTPVIGRYVLAGWWSRVGAQIIDGLILGVGALVLFIPIGAAFGLGFADSDVGVGALIAAALLWILCVAVIALLYAPTMMSRTNGKTVGRIATGIRVVRTSGQPITFGFAMLREVAVKTIGFGVAGALTGGLAQLVDYLWPLWDEENRCLHDFIVQTRVVKD